MTGEKQFAAYKILIIGTHDARRKSNFLSFLSDIGVVFDNGLNYPIKFGRLDFYENIDKQCSLFLFSTLDSAIPRADNLNFWEFFVENFLGIIYLVDSTDTEIFPLDRTTLIELGRNIGGFP